MIIQKWPVLNYNIFLYSNILVLKFQQNKVSYYRCITQFLQNQNSKNFFRIRSSCINNIPFLYRFNKKNDNLYNFLYSDRHRICMTYHTFHIYWLPYLNRILINSDLNMYHLVAHMACLSYMMCFLIIFHIYFFNYIFNPRGIKHNIHFIF